MSPHRTIPALLLLIFVLLCLIYLGNRAHGQTRQVTYLPIVAGPLCPSFAPVVLEGDKPGYWSCVWP